ncbi:MAG: hypothetical protein GSR81_06040 [Desulfurococcales archaeon]|nr:hypothetical protein [Desulfurococcales archaeon]
MGSTAQCIKDYRAYIPVSSYRVGKLIKTGGNRGYCQALSLGLGLVLEYFRILRRNGRGSPAYITISKIVKTLGVEDTRRKRTIIGWALNYLAKLGYMERWSNGSNKTYHVTDKLFEHFQNYPCLTDCTADGSLCGLIATNECPFLVGVVNDE